MFETKQKYLTEASRMPVFEICDELNRRLESQSRIIVTAPPGSGKSTILPLAILDGPAGVGKVLVLEPRRIAARQIAERMAELLEESTGKTVGYRIRFESRISDATRVEVLTEGILTRMMIDNPLLEGVSAIVFDEFHERNINSDVALALARELQESLRPELKIIIMSATIDSDSLCKTLGASLLESTGRMFPVRIINSRTDYSPNEIPERVAACISIAHREEDGDILAFLPGEKEIRRCEELLGDKLGDTGVFPLYGMLPQKQQRQAIAPSPEGKRKVVLATPIAETSLTIEGVRIVIDSGYCRKKAFNPQKGLESLETVMISKDMADQRAGRAGRLTSGVCYRLWTESTQARMPECRTPEISYADLTQLALDVAAWGNGSIRTLAWVTPPPEGGISQAERLLKFLGAIGDDGTITPTGRKMSSLPCHPRIAHMLSAGQDKSLAADIAAILEERDPIPGNADSSLTTRIAYLRGERLRGGDSGRWKRILQISKQYHQNIGVRPDNSVPSPEESGLLLSLAYPERIAKINEHGAPGEYLLACGDAAFLDKDDLLYGNQWICIASMNAQSSGGRIFLASPVDRVMLLKYSETLEKICWDSARASISARREYRIGGLVLSSENLNTCSREKEIEIIAEAAKKEWMSMFCISEEAALFQRRVALVSGWHPELELPEIRSEDIFARSGEWLSAFIGKARTGAELKRIDLMPVLRSMLSYSQLQEVDRLAPSHIEVPSGSRIIVDYRQGAELPVLKVRLQECFGMMESPRVDGGRRPVLMELLSPGFKPVQLTSDLHSFWENTYFEVRKELKRRYPKHSWPDNPLEAPAVRGVRKR